jgi:hypothetical protein
MEYFCFQGGDSRPHTATITAVRVYSYTPATPPPPDGRPTDLNTSESGVPYMIASDHSIFYWLHRPRWGSDRIESVLSLDPRVHPYGPAVILYTLLD